MLQNETPGRGIVSVLQQRLFLAVLQGLPSDLPQPLVLYTWAAGRCGIFSCCHLCSCSSAQVRGLLAALKTSILATNISHKCYSDCIIPLRCRCAVCRCCSKCHSLTEGFAGPKRGSQGTQHVALHLRPMPCIACELQQFINQQHLALQVTPAQLDAAVAKLHTALQNPGKTPESVALDLARDLKSHRKANTSASKMEAKSLREAVMHSNNTVLIDTFLKELFQVHKGPGFRVL